MGRGFGLVSLVSALAIVAGLWMLMARETGPTSERVKQAKAEATAAAGSINFSQAALELEAYRLENGTYAGAALAPAFGVTLTRADAASYCLQAGAGAAVQHYAGPGGTPAAGPC
jgi:Tfp pilus assembly protein PilE